LAIQFSSDFNVSKFSARGWQLRMHATLRGPSKIMSIVRNRNAFLNCVRSLLICAALIYGARPLFGQAPTHRMNRHKRANRFRPRPHHPIQASQDPHQPCTQYVVCGAAHLGQCLKDLGHDQAGIWTSPLRVSPRGAFWLVPFAAGTGVALHYDAQAQQELGIDKSRIDRSMSGVKHSFRSH
jgi:hypothetical protein